jgi:hypothetical protein
VRQPIDPTRHTVRGIDAQMGRKNNVANDKKQQNDQQKRDNQPAKGRLKTKNQSTHNEGSSLRLQRICISNAKSLQRARRSQNPNLKHEVLQEFLL